jgi:hypothetical protein
MRGNARGGEEVVLALSDSVWEPNSRVVGLSPVECFGVAVAMSGDGACA